MVDRTEDWDGEVVKESLNPNPGREGQMMWYAWPPSSGFERVLNKGVKERFVNGKLGRSSKGMALGDGERMCMKCIRIGAGVEKLGEGGGAMARRNWGRVVFR